MVLVVIVLLVAVLVVIEVVVVVVVTAVVVVVTAVVLIILLQNAINSQCFFLKICLVPGNFHANLSPKLKLHISVNDRFTQK